MEPAVPSEHAELIIRTLQDLQRAERQLQALQKIARIGIWQYRPQTGLYTWSTEASRILGVDELDGVAGQENFLHFLDPDDNAILRDAFGTSERGTPSFSLRVRAVGPDDAMKVIYLRAQLFDDRSGSGPQWVGTIQDVTGEAITFQSSDEDDALILMASEMAHLGGWKVELSSGHVYWSEQLLRLFGIPSGGACPTMEDVYAIIVKEFREEWRMAYEKCVREGTPCDVELKVNIASEKSRWIRVIAQAVRDKAGDICRVQGAAQDITQKKETEEKLKQLTARLVNTLESITDAFYTLDHDGNFTYVNKEAERLLRRPREELIGQALADKFEIPPGFARAMKEAIGQNHHVTYDEFNPPLNFWFEARIYPSVEGVAVYFTDVTVRKQAEAAIRESEERFKLLARATSDGIWDWDLKKNTVWINEGMVSLFDFDRQEYANGDELWTARIHPSERENIRQDFFAAIARDEDSWVGEYRFRRKDGTYADVLDRAFFIREDGNKVSRVICSMVDITERKLIEREHQKDEERLRRQASLLDKARDAIVVTDIHDKVIFWNKSAERMYGWTAAEASGKSKIDLVVHDKSAINQAFALLMANDEWSGEILKQRKDGSTLNVEAHWTLVRDEGGEPHSIMAIDTDITRRKAAEHEIERLAFYDPLTRLPNRRMLLDRLQHALHTTSRSHQSGALLFIDLDNFKTLNDTLGHDMGDMLLQQVASRLETCVRRSNTVARLGGDEFVVMLENLSMHSHEAGAQAEAVAEQVLAAFREPFKLHSHDHRSTPSIGVAMFNHQDDFHSHSVDELLKRADMAMYQAKAAGRNTIRFFDPGMQNVINARVTLERDLRQGLQRREFVLEYQPQTYASGQIFATEALVRWQHPRRGLVAPALFIPLAEETGIILDLGNWVLETACRQLAQWAVHMQTAHLKMAVNVSSRQFHHAEFVPQVLAVLRQTGADPRLLKLELTETLLVENLDTTIQKMAVLKKHGVSFSLDDFGTGYSSLSYLKRLPLDQLKIDQSFVRDVLTDPNDAAIARTILALGQTLSLEVVAEGVETEPQRDFLAEHGCHAYQGFFFSRPRRGDTFLR